MIGEDNSGGTPSSESLKADWADAYGVTHPVVADAGFGEAQSRSWISGGIPTYTLIAPGGEVLSADSGYSPSQIESILPY